MWNSADNGVTVRCRTKEEADTLMQIIQGEVGDKVEASKPKMRNPAFTIVTELGDNFKDEEGRINKAALEKDIKERNFLESSDENLLKVAYTKDIKNGKTLIILETGPGNYRAIKENKVRNKMHLEIGWNSCELREQEPVNQCFNCSKYWHKAATCRYSKGGQPAKRCYKCGENHDGKDCKATKLHCVNCADFNEHFKGSTKHDTGHSARDHKCPMYQNALKKARLLVKYV